MKNKKNQKIIVTIFTMTAILSPLLNMYGISEKYHTFTFREVAMLLILMICTLFSFVKRGRSKNTSIWFYSYIVVVILSMLINASTGDSESVLRVIRYLLILFFVFIFSEKYFNSKLGFKVYEALVIFASIFLITQVIAANYFGIEIKGYLSFIPTRSINLRKANGLLRFYSIFEEPGYYGMIMSGYLIIGFRNHKMTVLKLILVSAASLLSTATTSIVLLIFTLVLFYSSNLLVNHSIRKKHIGIVNKKKSRIILAITLVLLVFIVFTVTPQFEFVLNRLEDGHSANSRFGDNIRFLENFNKYDFFKILFGNGMNEYPINGFIAILVSYGILGFLIFSLMMINFFRKTNGTGRLLLLLFLFINIANVEVFGNASTIILFFPFIINGIRNKNQNRKEDQNEICIVM
ncbi:MAG: hypothetical protein RBQ97_03255 [Acholeplasma sp.]|nr:hypothetical protein [Acholeplasma sp.]